MDGASGAKVFICCLRFLCGAPVYGVRFGSFACVITCICIRIIWFASVPFVKVVLYYDRCIVGMDYATTTGTTRWWIYLSYGPLPKYKGKSPANRINSLRTKPGFVRIQFYEEVYEALLQVLPKHQKVCLQSAYNLHCRDEQ